MIPAAEALARLRLGNRRFVAGSVEGESRGLRERRREVAEQQRPFAVVLGCSDSRVPVEMVFDQGLGDLFAIRVAGNVAAPSQIGSVEFAAAQLGVRLVVVLGHSRCGAVLATIDELREPKAHLSRNLRAIVDQVRPSVEALMAADHDPDDLVDSAVRANIRASASRLRHGSRILEQRIHDGAIRVVGAEYSLDTGRVDFFDGV